MVLSSLRYISLYISRQQRAQALVMLCIMGQPRSHLAAALMHSEVIPETASLIDVMLLDLGLESTTSFPHQCMVSCSAWYIYCLRDHHACITHVIQGEMISGVMLHTPHM